MRFRAPALALVVATLAAPGIAQVTSGSIFGFVLDPDGRAVAGAVIAVSNTDRSLTRAATTDTTGLYRFFNLPPAVYVVRADAPRFAPAESGETRLAVDSAVKLDFQLSIAAAKDSVTVTSRPVAALPAAGSSDLGAVFDQSRIEALPLNRRDFLRLALLTPGVLPPVQESELSTRGSFAMHANGAREEANNYLLDGVDNNDFDVHRYVLQPAIDSIQEFKVAVNNYSAEYGRSGGGQVNVITRSGTNAWHGFAYEYLRNRIFDASNYFDPEDRAKYIRNQFGGGGGGPIRKAGTFLFVNADALRQRQGLSRLGTVPTGRQRAGDLAEAGAPVIDPFIRQPFAGGVIPPSRIAPLSSKVLALFPFASWPGLSGNYLSQAVAAESGSQVSSRLDHRVSERDNIAIRYSYLSSRLKEPFAEELTAIPGFGDVVEESGHNAMLQHVHVFSPRAISTALFGFNRGLRRIVTENAGTDVNRLWGVSWLPTRPLDYGYPAINVAGVSRVGDVTQLPIDRAANTYQLTDTLSVMRGAHAFKAGFEMRRQQHNGILDMFARGSLSFTGAITGSGMGDLLLGIPALGIQSQFDNTQTLRSTATNVYAQDDYKVSRHVTLNIGLRYEYNSPASDPTGRMSMFDPASGQIARVGPGEAPYRGDKNNFAPRVGVSWSPDAKLAVRGGYGVFYDSNMAVVSTSLYFNPPFFAIRIYFPTAVSMLSLENPFPRGGGITPAPSLSTIDPGLTAGYLQHWNLNVQRAVGAGLVTVAYAGSKGTRLIRSRDLNQPPPAAGPVDARRPYAGFGSIFFVESGSNSEFQSLQVSYDRPLARGVSALLSYMFSKSMDDTTAFLGTYPDKNFPQDSHNFHLEHGLSSFNIPHRATASVVWRVPPRWKLARNFEFSSIIVGESGQPFTPILRFDNSNTGNTGGQFGSDRPNLLGDPKLSDRGPEAWFRTSAFAVAPQYTFGTAGRNIVAGPGLFTMDVSLQRRFPIAERGAVTVYAQAFNVTNRTNFDLPQLYADDPAFGRIFSAKAPRQVQFALRLTF